MFTDVVIKKRHNGYAEIRSYMFDAIKAKGHGIRFTFIDPTTEEMEIMSIPHNQLNKGFVTAKGIKSKIIKGQVFDLISFIWETDGHEEHIEDHDQQLEIFDSI
tara:strand:- start:6952 stop:7263 length:312 start_codon:yes stop_codon:yes gene_type:complete